VKGESSVKTQVNKLDGIETQKHLNENGNASIEYEQTKTSETEIEAQIMQRVTNNRQKNKGFV